MIFFSVQPPYLVPQTYEEYETSLSHAGRDQYQPDFPAVPILLTKFHDKLSSVLDGIFVALFRTISSQMKPRRCKEYPTETDALYLGVNQTHFTSDMIIFDDYYDDYI